MIRHSKIYRGEVTHRRLGPVEHAFSYPMTFFGFDLSELPWLSAESGLLGYNRLRPLQIRDNDYLRGHDQSIGDQLEAFLPAEKPEERTLLISSPRYFGYAFNPVNFFLRLSGNELRAAVAEVNNTFGDRHIYPLPVLHREGKGSWTAICPKDFHVSPFNNMAGDYHFRFRIGDETIFLGVDLHREGECVMETWIHGRASALNTRAISRYALLHPLDTALNSMPRILWQAARLYYQKKMPVYQRPSPRSGNTLIDRDRTEEKRDVI